MWAWCCSLYFVISLFKNPLLLEQWNKYESKALNIMGFTELMVTTLNLCKIQILGDSKAVVEWVNGHNQMQVLRIKTLMAHICSFFASLEWFSINHIPRDLNSLADQLSKEVLLLHARSFIS